MTPFQRVHIITTGGCIEKLNQPGTPDQFRDDTIPTMVAQARLLGVSVTRFMAVDSQFITDADRDTLCDVIAQVDPAIQSIVVTHGTSTMPRTACYLQNELADYFSPAKKIVLTGAFKHLVEPNSDALPNLASAVSVARRRRVQPIPDWITEVSICMGGMEMRADEVFEDEEETYYVERGADKLHAKLTEEPLYQFMRQLETQNAADDAMLASRLDRLYPAIPLTDL